MNMNMNMNMNTDFPEESDDRKGTKLPSSTTTTSSPSWLKMKNPRIVRVSRAFGGKDRHSKVCTVRGLRDRRIRLSVPTAIQLYDLQDRLGLNQPSKVVDWLINAAKDDIDDLPPLQMPPLSFISRSHHAPPHAQLLNINPAAAADWAERSGTTFSKGKSKEEGHQVMSTTSNNNYMSSSLWEPNFGGSSTMSIHGGFDHHHHHHHVPLPAQILVCPTTTTQPYFPEVVDPSRQMSQFQMLMMSSAGAAASSHNHHHHHLLHNSSAHNLYSARPFFTHDVVGAPHEDSQNDVESEQDKNQEHFQER